MVFYCFALLPILDALFTGVSCQQQQQKDLSWPCVSNLCPDKVTTCSGDFGCPPPHCDPSRPNDSVCEGAGCRRDAASPTGGTCGTFINFSRKKVGERCTTHSECRAMFLCRDGQCHASRRIGTYSICSVDSRQQCPDGEECFTGDTVGNEGVCLKVSSDPDQFQLDVGQPFGTTHCANANTGRLGGPCKWSDLSCDVPFMCVDGCCGTTANNKNWKGQRIPPQPNDPNCRDALDSGETDTDISNCVDKKRLCTDRRYRRLMREQCPKTCGYCDGQGPSSTEEEDPQLERKANTATGGEGDGTEEALMGCSDRTVSGRQSDCPRLKYLCEHDAYRQLMRRQCPKTCGLCTDDE